MQEEFSIDKNKNDLTGSGVSQTPEHEVIQKPQKVPSWLPDWKKTEGYPDPKGTVSREQWAWEFIRRNPKYQQLYREGRRHKESWYKKFPKSNKFYRYFKCSPKASKGESYEEYIARCELENITPKITPKRQRILNLFPVVKFSAKLNPAKTIPPEFNKDYGYPLGESPEDEQKIDFPVQGMDEFFMVFSVALPIKAQIDKAEKLLTKQQKYYEEQGHQLLHKGRVQFHKLRNYLRYLDGKMNGATQVEIARVVHPKEDQNSARQRVNKGLQAAEDLRDIGYLKILGTELLK